MCLKINIQYGWNRAEFAFIGKSELSENYLSGKHNENKWGDPLHDQRGTKFPQWRFCFEVKKKKSKEWSDFWREAGGVCLGPSGKLAQLCAGPAYLWCACGPYFSASGLPSGHEDSRCPAVFSLQWCSVPGMLLWMLPQDNDFATHRTLRPGTGRNSVLMGLRCTADSWMCISGICQVSHTRFGPLLEPFPRPLSVKITFSLLYLCSCRWNIVFVNFNVKCIF